MGNPAVQGDHVLPGLQHVLAVTHPLAHYVVWPGVWWNGSGLSASAVSVYFIAETAPNENVVASVFVSAYYLGRVHHRGGSSAAHGVFFFNSLKTYKNTQFAVDTL
jgi:hypothetical protein